MTDRLDQAFAALSDATRRDLVARLAIGDATVGELAAPYDMTVQAVSKHVKVLEDAGLVQSSKDGLWVNYSLSGGGVSPYAATLLGNLKHWLVDDPEIRRLSEALPAIRREVIVRKRSV